MQPSGGVSVTVDVVNCTIYGNSGIGVSVTAGGGNVAAVAVRNSIVAGNTDSASTWAAPTPP